jgi:hypothetical protein
MVHSARSKAADRGCAPSSPRFSTMQAEQLGIDTRPAETGQLV